MTRLALSVAVAAAALMVAAPALAGDYNNFFGNSDDLRSGFSQNWDNSDANDPLSFELGLRYWYSMGAQDFSVNGAKLTESDHSHSLEGQFRVDDHSSKYYAKGLAGMSFAISGDGFNDATSSATTVSDGHLAYAGADIGYSWVNGDPKAPTFGPFAGYMYWNDSPNIGRQNYTVGTATANFTYDPVTNHIVGPGDSQEDDVMINALRLGLSGKANFGNYFDVSGEVAAVPYAKINGTLGAFGVPVQNTGVGGLSTIQSSAASIDGWGYGAMGELMVGFHPTDNLTFRVGGRAWYLQGQADTTFNTVTVRNDSTHAVTGSQEYISTSNPWSLFRYGLLTEMTYNF